MRLGQHYEYTELIGSGGMGDVHRGVRLATNHPVAVKLLRREYLMDEAFVARFVSEKNILRSLESPNIVAFYDFVVETDTCAIVMELIDGVDLRTRMLQGRVPVDHARQISLDLLNGLAKAHHEHVVHRDVKPSNVLLTTDHAGRSVAKLGDFGIATIDGVHQPAGSSTGTRPYMAPEVLAGATPDTRSDVYSAGVLIHELVTGARPADRTRRPARPDGWPDSANGIDWQCVADMLDPDPARRPTARDAVNAISGNTVIPRSARTGPLTPAGHSPAHDLHPVGAGAARSGGRRIPRWLAPAALGTVTLVALAVVLPNCSAQEDAVDDGPVGTEAGGDPSGTDAPDATTSPDATTGTDATGSSTDGTTAGDPADPADSLTPIGTASEDRMVRIDGGTFLVGADNPAISQTEKNAESPTIQVQVNTFYVDQFEVTNRQYREFAEVAQAPPAAGWDSQGFPDDRADHPVQGVSYGWAVAYCSSIGKRLPTEIEWEIAASGTDRRPYPWGTDPAAAELPDEGTYPVGSLAANVSPFEVHDLAGNAWEWVAKPYGDFIPSGERVLRGGENGWLRKNTLRLPIDPLRSNAATKAGFRCAADEVDPARAPGDFQPLPLRPEDVVPEKPPTPEGYVVSDQFDDPGTGWVEQTQADFRFGYHPNSFFHLETKAPGTTVLAQAPVALDPTQAVRIVANVFVDAPNTDPGGSFEYGLVSRLGDDGSAIVFVIDPRTSRWRVLARSQDGSLTELQGGQRAFRETDTIELAIEQRGESMAFFIAGARVWGNDIGGFGGLSAGLFLRSSDDSPKAHIHFDTYDILELTS